MEGWMELKPDDFRKRVDISYGANKSYITDNWTDDVGIASFALNYAIDSFTNSRLSLHLPSEMVLKPVRPNVGQFFNADGTPMGNTFALPSRGWVTGHYRAGFWTVNIGVSTFRPTPGNHGDPATFYTANSDAKILFLAFGPENSAFDAMNKYQAANISGPQARPSDNRWVGTVPFARQEAFGAGLHHLRGEYANKNEVTPEVVHVRGITTSFLN